MTEVEVLYNPFLVETIIKIDGKIAKPPNPLAEFAEDRLQIWADEFYEKLVETCEDQEYSVYFYGMRADALDLREALNSYQKKNPRINIKQSYQLSAMEQNRLVQVKELFIRIQKESPFDELKDPQLIANFKAAIGEEFPISVIGTMSSGKSTLLNALLGRELMPMKSKACTAIETMIRDNKREKEFTASIFDESHQLIKQIQNVNRKELEKWNDNPQTAMIELSGPILNIKTKGTRLCFADTPGTNNSRNISHKERTYDVIYNQNKPMLIYVINGKKIGVNDDKILLSDVAKAMAVRGKQTKERFVFVVTHMDECSFVNQDVNDVLDEVRRYLAQFGIKRPNIFPCSGRYAMNIRRVMRGDKDEDDIGYYDFLLEKEYAFSSMAPLSSDNQARLRSRKIKAKKEGNKLQLALLETGVPAIELAIEEYLEKYVYMNKVKSAVDTFQKQLEVKNTEARLLDKINQNEEERQKTYESIAHLEKLLEEGKAKEDFREQISRLDLESEIQDEFQRLRKDISSTLNNSDIFGICMSGNEQYAISQIEDQFSSLHSRIHAQAESFLKEKIQSMGNQIMDKYEECLGGLIQEGIIEKAQFSFTAVGFVRSSLPSAYNIISRCRRVHQRKVGERFVRDQKGILSTIKGAVKYLFTGDNSGLGHYESIYETESYTDLGQFQREYKQRAEQVLQKELVKTEQNTIRELNVYRDFYIKEVEKIDGFLKESLSEIKQLSLDKEKLEQKLLQEEQKKNWLEEINAELANVLAV